MSRGLGDVYKRQIYSRGVERSDTGGYKWMMPCGQRCCQFSDVTEVLKIAKVSKVLRVIGKRVAENGSLPASGGNSSLRLEGYGVIGL
mgnify:CR=1 FL=1